MVEAGYRVVVTWVVEGERERAEERFGDAVELRRLDVAAPADVEALAADLASAGEPWAVAHLVGGYHGDDPFDGLDLAAWNAQFRLNVDTLAVVLRAFVGGMAERGGGRVVAVSSRTALRPFAGAAAYAASKAAVIATVAAAS